MYSLQYLYYIIIEPMHRLRLMFWEESFAVINNFTVFYNFSPPESNTSSINLIITIQHHYQLVSGYRYVIYIHNVRIIILQGVSSLRSLTPLQFIPHRVNRKGTLLYIISAFMGTHQCACSY